MFLALRLLAKDVLVSRWWGVERVQGTGAWRRAEGEKGSGLPVAWGCMVDRGRR